MKEFSFSICEAQLMELSHGIFSFSIKPLIVLIVLLKRYEYDRYYTFAHRPNLDMEWGG